MNAMRSWASESVFSTFLIRHYQDMDKADTTPILSHAPTPADQARLKLCITSLLAAEPLMTLTSEQANFHKGLLNFTQNLRSFPPGPTAPEQFKVLYPLRGWLFWMPTSLFCVDQKDPGTLLCFAYFNATVLAVRPF